MPYLLLLLYSPSLAGQGNDPPRLQVTVGLEQNYPPYSYLDAEGRVTGFNLELAKAVAAVSGLQISIDYRPWREIRDDLESAKLGAIAGMYYSKTRDDLLDFSQPYMMVNHGVFARDNSPEVLSEENLRDKEIIVMQGDIMHDYALEKQLTGSLILAQDQAEALKLLSSGRHDYALLAKLPGLYWVKELGLSNIVTTGPPLLPSKYCFAVKAGNSDLLFLLSEGLAVVKETGEYRRIYNHYLGVLEPRTLSKLLLLKYAAAVFVIALILSIGWFAWYRSLRKQVTERTAELTAEIFSRRKTEEILAEKEAFLKTLIDSIPLPIFYKDSAGRFLGINKSYEEYIGKKREEVIGSTVSDMTAPDLARLHRARDEELFRTAIDQKYESRVRTADGLARDVIFYKSIFPDAKHKIKGLIGVIWDITEQKIAEETLKKSEEKFRILFESSKDANYISLPDGRIIEANQSFLTLFGCSKEELPGLSFLSFYVDPADRILFLEEIEKSGFTKEFELKMRDKKGNTMTCQITATVRHDADGAIFGYQGIIRDVTEMKNRQFEREQLIAELETALIDVKTLSGLLPICSFCKKIRDDRGYWKQIEEFLGQHSGAQFSHGICRDCAEKYYPDAKLYDDEKQAGG
jgi:PAS domain S-box-containing protein